MNMLRLIKVVSYPRAESGFTLIEGMLGAAVLAVGLLALAGMQGISLGRNVDANQLTVATNLAADMVERIQFNRRMPNINAYNNIDTLIPGTRPATDPTAAGDYDQWQARLTASGLSGVQGQVSVSTIGPTTPTLNQNQVVVTVMWNPSAMRADRAVARNRRVVLATVIAPE
jgi:type IV pilus assembly protein PilV